MDLSVPFVPQLRREILLFTTVTFDPDGYVEPGLQREN
jgi:hypothetical protein